MSAELVVVKGNHRGGFAQLHHSAVTIGRSHTVHLSLESDTKVSGQHAKVTPLGGNRFVIEDLGSTNGTFVNEERIDQVPLRSGDLIKIGRHLLIFRSEGASVHLSDINTKGGGSSVNLRPSAADSRVQAPAAVDEDEGGPTPLPKLEAETTPTAQLEQQMLQELILAAGELDLRRGLERGLAALLAGTGAGRALLFLRHPHTGGLGCAAAKALEGVEREAAVDPELLTKAARGEVVTAEHAVSAPLMIHGQPQGALYLDGGENPHPGLKVKILTAAGLQLGLLIAADRSARLAASATEIVGLAQAQVSKRPVDLAGLLQGTDRLYSVAAERRRLSWSVDAKHGLHALADPLLVGRGLDTLVEHVLGVARGSIVIAAQGDETRAHVTIQRPLVESPEAVTAMLDPEGVAADLRRAAQTLDDGALAVARVALLRGGAALTIRVEGPAVIYAIDMEAAPASGGGVL